MKRVWSQVEGSTVVNRTIGAVKRRKLNAIEFPIPGLNEDVWCQTLKFFTPEQATILRMVCKYFRIERFVRKENGKEKPVKNVCKDAILGTNNPTFLTELPGVRLTQEKLRVLKSRCHQQDCEVELFKYAIACGTTMKTSDWFDLAAKGSRKALDWVKELPTPWVTSRKGFMPGLYVRGDPDLIAEFTDHLQYQWNETRVYALMDSKLTDGKGLEIIYNHLIGRKVIPQLGSDKTFSLCVIASLITTHWYGPANPTKRAEALEMIDELTRALDTQQKINGEPVIDFTLIDTTCKSFKYEESSILYRLLGTGHVAHALMIWTFIKSLLPVGALLKVLVACTFDTTMMIRAVHKYVSEFTEEKQRELRDNPNYILNAQVLDRVRLSVFGRTAGQNRENIECYRQFPNFPAFQ
uniref:Uncharacterized protein n=1 Tax=Clandestinovirus TaxID=2831644 RepID=A0A8F8PK80_9VIRU|nr:hypothetical protein KOM_12_217 [Clandestinovirus]